MPLSLRRAGIAGSFLLCLLVGAPALATPSLVMDFDTGQVLINHEATRNWYPASLTKLMTLYVALHAVRDGRITMDTPFVMSARAARMPPSKMGFRPGTEVTLDNAIKMLMVKSPNDVAMMIGEGVSGSVDAFAQEMNGAAARLGLKETYFVNPNGLPDTRQVTSARDMAIIARALLMEFPQERDLFDIGELQLGNEIIRNHNGLIGRYPGADGMKTGFTCAAGFNVVASATHNGRRLIVVVLGAPSARERTVEAAALFDRGFAQRGGEGSIESLPSPGIAAAPDMRGEVCSRRGRAALRATEEEEIGLPPASADPRGRGGQGFSLFSSAAPDDPRAIAALPAPHFEPTPIFIGPKPGWTGPVAAARPSEPAAQKASFGAPPAGANAYAATPADGTPGAAGAIEPLALPGAVSAGSPLWTAPEKAKLAARGRHGARGKSAVRARATGKPLARRTGAGGASGAHAAITQP